MARVRINVFAINPLTERDKHKFTFEASAEGETVTKESFEDIPSLAGALSNYVNGGYKEDFGKAEPPENIILDPPHDRGIYIPEGELILGLTRSEVEDISQEFWKVHQKCV